MKKLLIGILVVLSLGVVGCGAKEQAPNNSAKISWEQVEKEVFTGNMGHMEVIDRIEKSNFDTATKEDLKAIAYELIYVRGEVVDNKIKAEAQKLLEMREKNPDSWLYDYGVERDSKENGGNK